VLLFAGLRIGELTALRWRDVDLATGWLHIGEAKTDAGRRRVKLRGTLRDEGEKERLRALVEGEVAVQLGVGETVAVHPRQTSMGMAGLEPGTSRV
jgi:integrase